jgi:(heptosyl)LPS beta-1,4-glucosyltransferase
VLTDYIPGTSLYRHLRYENPSQQQIRQLAQQVACIWQHLDDLRVQHNDFKTENFLLDPHGKLWLIDLERMRRCRSEKQTRTRQMRDLSALFHPRNWRSNPEAAEIFRQAFLELPAIQASIKAAAGKPHPLKRPFRSSNQESQLVTALIPCHNAAGTIRACLESVRDLADEILVVDGGSQDETLRIVREFGGCRIVERRGLCFAERVGIGHKFASHAWILRLNADEQCNPELSKHVQDILAREPMEDGFRVRREICFRGHRLRFGGVRRELSLRLYRKNSVRCELRNGEVHLVHPSAKVGRLAFPIEYETCNCLHQLLVELLADAATGARTESSLEYRPRMGRLLWSVPWEFFKSYVLRGGCFDGLAGLHACSVTAIAVYLCEAMLWDQRQGGPSRVTPSDECAPDVIKLGQRRAA